MATVLRSHTLVKVAVLTLALALLTAGEILASSPALAVHVSCGDTITTDTTLDSDLVDCPNNGIIIGADDITLDLNGHTIDGDDALVDPCPEDEFCDIGVANDGHNGVSIKGGAITEFAFGVFLFRARGNDLSDLSSTDHVFGGIILVQAARNHVRRSATSRSAGPDSGVGITLFESPHNRIAHNRSVNNAELGIHLIRSNHNYVGNNLVRGNPEDGIILEGGGNLIVGNRVLKNAITITLFSGPDAQAVGNVVRRNVVRRAPRGGIAIDSAVEGTVVKRNHVSGAGGHGIVIGNPATRVTRNEARFNDGLGILAVEGVIDGGGNRARGNGDPRQCVNVACR